MPHDDFLTRRQLADLYPIPYSTLKKLSMRGSEGGPPVIRLGDRVYYHVPSFEKWLTSFLSKDTIKLPNSGSKRRRGRPRKSEQVAARG